MWAGNCRRVEHKHHTVDQSAAALAFAGWSAAEACLAAGCLLLRSAAVHWPDVAHLCEGHVWPGRLPAGCCSALAYNDSLVEMGTSGSRDGDETGGACLEVRTWAAEPTSP